jgi:hypothetical protein
VVDGGSVGGGADGQTWFVGSTNGGIWRTRTKELQSSQPHWDCVTDNQPVTCSAIASLKVSTADANLVVAGCGGSTSSEMGGDWNIENTGDYGGVMLSRDGGDSWTMTNCR